jgi:ATP-dependent helicase HrpB
LQALPIDPLLPEVIASLRARPSLVLEAPPGAGKTTRVPRAMLDAGLAGEHGEILVLEPRRLAARLAAKRVAEEMGEELGGTVGYQVRFEDVSSKRTRIRFVTEGIVTRKLVADPELRGVACVVVDEFHERHLHGDIALAWLKRLQTRRPLSLVVMSATLDAAPVAAYLDCPQLRSEGRRFDVKIEHLPAPEDRPLESLVASAVRALLKDGLDGHVLVFLPGAAEIRRCKDALEKYAAEHDLVLLPLHGDLPPAEQDRAVRPSDKRKILLATNVAESSVTIEGVAAVIDSGLARVARHSPWSGLPELRVEKVSRASATQRAGRAGRTREGRCLRLYTKADFDARTDHDAPEIRRADLAQTALELAAADARDLSWLEAPPDEAWRAASELLVRLGAITVAGAITARGKRMLAFPLHPRQARLVVEGEARGVAEDACVVAALVAEREIRLSQKTSFGERGRQADTATEDSDVVAMLDAFREAEGSGFSQHALRAIGLDPGAVYAVDRAQKQLGRMVSRGGKGPSDVDAALRMCVLAGYPDRVAKRRKFGSRDLALAAGGMAELAERSQVRKAELMVCVDADGARSPPLVRVASGIEPEWLLELFEDRIRETTEVTWNAQAERVEAKSRMLYDAVALTESSGSSADEEAVARALAERALAKGARAFAPEGELDRWLARARFAASVEPSVPSPTDDDVRAAMVDACAGKRSFAELAQASLLDLLRARFSMHLARIDALAPERLPLASGRNAKIEYEDGKPHVESYLQDFFGMKESPKVGGGRVPLVVHLLAPNKRAVQVTQDLAGFWERHYPSIKKELARKYPRHAWPEDPHTAIPMRFGRRG